MVVGRVVVIFCWDKSGLRYRLDSLVEWIFRWDFCREKFEVYSFIVKLEFGFRSYDCKCELFRLRVLRRSSFRV